MKRQLNTEYIAFEYEFKAQPSHGFMSTCGIQLRKRSDEKIIVIATDLGGFVEDTGTSVTNACEAIATMIRRDYEIVPDQLIFVEHYLKDRYHNSEPETFDLVSFTLDGDRYHTPQWKHLAKEEFERIIEHSEKLDSSS